MVARICVGLVPLLAGLFIGCSGGDEGPPVYPATAVVTQDGKPLTEVSVTLVPEDPAQPQAIGSVAPDGTVSFSTGQRLGAVAGKHKVIIQSTAMPDAYRSTRKGPPKSSVPAEWSDPNKTPHSVTVTEDGPNEFKIDF